MTKVLDCTIRDGGHLCNWNFDKKLVEETYLTACKSNIDFFEIGYRTNNNSNGIYANCNEEIIPKGSSAIVIMVNASDFTPEMFRGNENLFVRVACHNNEIKQGIEICETLHQNGYGVFLHLMNIDKIEDFTILEAWQNKKILTSIYFADSFGALIPNDIEFYYKKLQHIGFENISFHGHNNMQLAFANTLKAIELGAYSVDATVFGIGRGAGNLPIELLIGHLKTTDPKYYFDLIEKHYTKLNLKWGYNIQTLKTGLENVHPNKILA